MPLILSMYEMPDSVLVDVCQLKPSDVSVDELIKQPVSSGAKRKVTYMIPLDKKGIVSAQNLQLVYINALNEKFGPQVDEGPNFIEYSAFSHKHIEPVLSKEDRLVKRIIPPTGHNTEEVYDVIDNFFKTELKQQEIKVK